MRLREVVALVESLRVPAGAATVPVIKGPQLPPNPGRFVLVSSTSGPGLDSEEIVDTQGFQLRVVGDQHDYESAEDLAWNLDREIIRFGAHSKMVDDTWVVSIKRAGSAPSVLEQDEAFRWHLVCTYNVQAESRVRSTEEA